MTQGIRVLCLKISRDGPDEPIYGVRFNKKGWGDGPFEEDGLTIFSDRLLVKNGKEGELEDISTLSGCRNGVIIEMGMCPAPKGTALVIAYGELRRFLGIRAGGGFIAANWLLRDSFGTETRMTAFSSLLSPGEMMTLTLWSGSVTYVENRGGHIRVLSDIFIFGLD